MKRQMSEVNDLDWVVVTYNYKDDGEETYDCMEKVLNLPDGVIFKSIYRTMNNEKKRRAGAESMIYICDVNWDDQKKEFVDLDEDEEEGDEETEKAKADPEKKDDLLIHQGRK